MIEVAGVQVPLAATACRRVCLERLKSLFWQYELLLLRVDRGRRVVVRRADGKACGHEVRGCVCCGVVDWVVGVVVFYVFRHWRV